MGSRMCMFEADWGTNPGLLDFLDFLRSVGVEVRTDASSDLVSIVYPTELPLDAESVRARALDMVHMYETRILVLEGEVGRLRRAREEALRDALGIVGEAESALKDRLARIAGDEERRP